MSKLSERSGLERKRTECSERFASGRKRYIVTHVNPHLGIRLKMNRRIPQDLEREQECAALNAIHHRLHQSVQVPEGAREIDQSPQPLWNDCQIGVVVGLPAQDYTADRGDSRDIKRTE